MDAAANIIESAFFAMDGALRLPASIALEYAALRVETGLPRPTVEDLEGLFQAMAKAAHLYRLHDGPAPAQDPDGWRRTAARCGAVCREASMQYLSRCIDKGQVIGGPVRERLNAWDYMAALFSSWPALSGCTGAAEPPSIAAEATSEPAEAATGAGIGKPLYSLQTSHNRQELARIYAALVDAGYIDGSAPDACGAFCRAFDPAADQQGRIAWAWTDKRTGRVSPGRSWTLWPKWPAAWTGSPPICATGSPRRYSGRRSPGPCFPSFAPAGIVANTATHTPK